MSFEVVWVVWLSCLFLSNNFFFRDVWNIFGLVFTAECIYAFNLKGVIFLFAFLIQWNLSKAFIRHWCKRKLSALWRALLVKTFSWRRSNCLLSALHHVRFKEILSQQAHDVVTTILTFWRRYNVHSTSFWRHVLAGIV